jgi:hypothetical protein
MSKELEFDTAAAIPSARAAEVAIDSMNKKELADLRMTIKPANGVEDVFAAMLALLGEPAKKRDWSAVQKALGNVQNLVSELKSIRAKMDDGKVTVREVDAVRPYLMLEHFRADVLGKRCKPAGMLCDFIVNTIKYWDGVANVEPKRRALRMAQVYICVFVCFSFVCVYIYIHIYTHTQTYIHTQAKIEAPSTNITTYHICICARVHTHIHMHTYIHTHIQTPAQAELEAAKAPRPKKTPYAYTYIQTNTRTGRARSRKLQDQKAPRQRGGVQNPNRGPRSQVQAVDRRQERRVSGAASAAEAPATGTAIHRVAWEGK